MKHSSHTELTTLSGTSSHCQRSPPLPRHTICMMCGWPMNVFKHILGTINQAFHSHVSEKLLATFLIQLWLTWLLKNLNFLLFLEAQINVGFWQLNNAHVPGGGEYWYKQKHTPTHSLFGFK